MFENEQQPNPVNLIPRKQGRFSRILTGEWLIGYEESLANPDWSLDDYIHLLNGMIQAVIVCGGESFKLMIQALQCLDRLTKTNMKFFRKKDKKSDEDFVKHVFTNVGLHAGVPLETLLKNPFKQSPSEA